MSSRLPTGRSTLMALVAAISIAAVAALFASASDARPQLDDASLSLLSLLAVAAVSGLAAMAVLEVAKELLSARRSTHSRALTAVYGETGGDYLRKWAAARSVRGELLALPVEALARQLSEFADQELRAPSDDGTALRYMASPPVHSTDEKAEATLAHAMRQIVDAASPGSPGTSPDSALLDAIDLVRVRVASRLDDFQIAAGDAWRRTVRFQSAILSGTIAATTTAVTGGGTAVSVGAGISGLVFGGYVAWLVRDTTKLIERSAGRL